MNTTLRTKGELALLLATFIWGLTFPFIRIVLQEMHSLQLVFLRGIIAGLIFLPFILLIKQNKKNLIRLLPMGAILGILYFTSYFSQAIGLETISSGRSAFITNLSVIFVPLLSPLFKRGSPSRNDIISCVIALCGMYFLCNPFGQTGINIGDFWTLLTAICFSIQIHSLQWAMEYKPFPLIYSFWQVTFVGLFSLIFMPFYKSNIYTTHISTGAILALIYLAVIAMVLATWIQSRYQGYTSPERAAVIYIIEPVFACFFGYIILNETMSVPNLFGGFLIIFAVLWVYIVKLFYKIRKDKINDF
ncbi:MAG: DMT family transporter [Bdellovibrionota bacterium]